MGSVAFGSYRISNRSRQHKEALLNAIESGCKLIDTSSNYTDGESETLVGEVLSSFKGKKPLIVSKVGYIQGQNLENFEKMNKSLDCINEVVDFGDSLKHCIHPEFIVDQVERSLKRLNLDSLDVYLLHNPEYYLKKEGSQKTVFYERITKAFMCLEDLVKTGKIKAYGVSSNTLISPVADKEFVDLNELIKCARSLGEKHHFKYIQFPLNLLELGALERQHDGKHLLDVAKENSLITMSNRPLNAFSGNGLVRLANYDFDENLNDEFAEQYFMQSISSLFSKWDDVKEDEEDKLFEIPFMRQMSQIWFKQNSEDAVSQIFFQHFFPFVAQVWGEDLSAEESKPFYDLYEMAQEFARKNMSELAEQFRHVAVEKGLISESKEPLDIVAIEKYLSFEIDYVLVGMKRPEYVERLKTFF